MSDLSSMLNAKALMVAIFLLLAVNIIIVDAWIMNTLSVWSRPLGAIQTVSLPKPSESMQCPTACLEAIYMATESVRPTPSIASPQKGIESVSGGAVKEYFISFGSGSNSSDDWIDVPGLQASIDSNQYGRIKNVVFEASVFIPTGNQAAFVRLYNITDNHPVWFSELSHEGGEGKLLVSGPITLDTGKKRYQVQMKTSLKYPASLTQSRVHITIY